MTLFKNVSDSIDFTCEREHEGRFHFLDVAIENTNDQFLTSVYRKPTWSGLYMSYHSFVPLSYKRGLVKTLYSRAYRICSPSKLQTELSTIKATLLSNGYPLDFIEEHSAHVADPPAPKPEGPDRKAIYLRLPYIGEPAMRMVRRELTATMRIFPAAELKILPVTTPIPIASPKDILPVLSIPNVVYQFTCACGLRYVGKTRRCLSQRIKEHLPRWLNSTARRPPRSTRPPQSAITRHLQTCAADPTLAHKNFKILYRPRSQLLLDILEALVIRRTAPPLCQQKEHLLTLLLPW